MKKMPAPQDIYQIKVTLLGTRPPIWRRLLVPAGLTLEQLHDALQAAIGWEDCHMHEFRIDGRRFGQPDPNDRLIPPRTVSNERTTRLFSVLGNVGAKAVYTYDFGDSWEHAIAVEKVLPLEPGLRSGKSTVRGRTSNSSPSLSSSPCWLANSRLQLLLSSV
jgi:hypothetical protein